MTGQNCALQLGAHGVLDAHDAREWILALTKLRDEVLAEFVLHMTMLMTRGTQGAQSGGKIGRWRSVFGHTLTVSLFTQTREIFVEFDKDHPFADTHLARRCFRPPKVSGHWFYATHIDR